MKLFLNNKTAISFSSLQILAISLAYSLFPAPIFAAELPPIPDSPIKDFCGVVKILDIASRWMFWILIMVSIIFVLVAAYKYLTSSGDSDRVGRAHKTLTFAAIAVAVALLARGFPFLIISFMQADELVVFQAGECVSQYLAPLPTQSPPLPLIPEP